MSTTMDIDKAREAMVAAIEEHNRLNASYGTIIAKVREALAELGKPAEPVAWMFDSGGIRSSHFTLRQTGL